MKVKNLCTKITELDTEEPISDARLRRYLIRGLRKEFMSFISSVQGWTTQPSIIELEKLLSNQEALMKQMLNQSTPQADDVLYARDQGRGKFKQHDNSSESRSDKLDGQSKRNSVTCYRCDKQGLIKETVV